MLWGRFCNWTWRGAGAWKKCGRSWRGRAAPEAASKPERKGAYKHVGRTLRRFAYRRLGKKGKGLVKCYLESGTGLSRAQAEQSW